MMFELFDHFERSDKEWWRFDESSFQFLNRASISFIEERRGLFESWFARYSESHRPDLSKRFRSSDDYEEHYPAFSELAVHELLKRLECNLTPHPIGETEKGNPDFLVEESNGECFIVEVVTPTGVRTISARRRATNLYQAVNAILGDVGYQIEVWEKQLPADQLSAKRVANFLKQELESVNKTELVKLYEREQDLPRWHYHDEDLALTFTPVPECCLGQSIGSMRAIETVVKRAHIVQWNTVKEKLHKKVGAYGKMKLPYVIAANILDWGFPEEHVKLALFGPDWDREDGLWCQNGLGTNTRVSAVLAIVGLEPIRIEQAHCRLWLNPWAERPYQGGLLRLPRAVAERKHRGGKIEWHGGASLSEVYGLTKA